MTTDTEIAAAPAVLDVTGQVDGPSPEEQAIVDAEQVGIIAGIKAERAPIDEAERAALQAKIDAANEAAQVRRDLMEAVKALTARVVLLEAKVK